jgi:pyruvyltransferase
MRLQFVLRSAYITGRLLIDDSVILIVGYQSKNWGDALNPILVQQISRKKPVIATKYTYNFRKLPVYSVIGSVLERPNINNCGHGNLIVWGTGFISSQGMLNVRPKEICAVRGPLTRERLLIQGYECPEVYGDPALLYPKYYKPNVQKKYKLGIIPHYVDREDKLLKNFLNDTDTLIIDIQSGIHNVVDQICSCQKIASSSLHGIIAADAYGIQSTWIKISDKITGGSFKYLDYFMSVGRNDIEALVIQEDSSIDDILDTYTNYKLDINLNELWEACPFRCIGGNKHIS